MAGTVSITHEHLHAIAIVVVAWTADGSGDADGTTVANIASGTDPFIVVGELIKGVTIPGTAGTQPDDNYNVVLTNSDGVNILANAEADLLTRDETDTEEVYFHVTDTGGNGLSMAPVTSGPLTITVDSAGASNTGVVKLYYHHHS